jgi:hypothetical protein
VQIADGSSGRPASEPARVLRAGQVAPFPGTQELDMKIKTKVRAGRSGCGGVVIGGGGTRTQLP